MCLLLPRLTLTHGPWCSIPASLGAKLGQRILARSLRAALTPPEERRLADQRRQQGALRQSQSITSAANAPSNGVPKVPLMMHAHMGASGWVDA